MLDDIQDGSQLRRGKPSTHTIFGLGQTINSSSYKICEALEEVLKLNSLECVHIVIEESKALYIGQSLDLHWSTNLEVPSVEDYIKVLDASKCLRYLGIADCQEGYADTDKKPADSSPCLGDSWRPLPPWYTNPDWPLSQQHSAEPTLYVMTTKTLHQRNTRRQKDSVKTSTKESIRFPSSTCCTRYRATNAACYITCSRSDDSKGPWASSRSEWCWK